jgi:hypothetical protein
VTIYIDPQQRIAKQQAVVPRTRDSPACADVTLRFQSRVQSGLARSDLKVGIREMNRIDSNGNIGAPDWLKLTNGVTALMGLFIGIWLIARWEFLALIYGVTIAVIFLAPAFIAWSGRALAFMTLLYFSVALMLFIFAWMQMPEGHDYLPLAGSLTLTLVAGFSFFLTYRCYRSVPKRNKRKKEGSDPEV